MDDIQNQLRTDIQQQIHEKGFNMLTGPRQSGEYASPSSNFNKIKIGSELAQHVAYYLETTDFKKGNARYGDRDYVVQCISKNDIKTLREISDYYYRMSGIYNRLIKYFAFTYNYDWTLTPIMGEGKVNDEKILSDYNKCLFILDSFSIKKNLGQIALKVLKDGAYYGYLLEQENKTFVLQELPIKYCRSRYTINGRAAVEFNLKYFDTEFKDAVYRGKILRLFPKEIIKAYTQYKKGTLKQDFEGDEKGWYLLDYTKAVKFNLNSSDCPFLIYLIPLIIDLAAAQKLDKDKTAQRLAKLIIQKLPLDKQGELLFDVEEAREIHHNAVGMVNGVIGTEVLTTFADVAVEDMDGDSDQQDDDLARVERQLYNEAGVSEMLFNTDGNLALERSMLNDAATMRDLIYQFEEFLNLMTLAYSNPKKVEYRVQILPTTIYNFKDMFKLYQDQSKLGFSLLLPQISLGASQSSVVSSLKFENDILKIHDLLTPPLSTNTATGADIKGKSNEGNNGESKNTGTNKTVVKIDEKSAGRPEKADEEKSEKTIANQESAS